MRSRAVQRAGAGTEPATLRTLVDQVSDQLQWDIIIRRLAPGERLREVELATRFGVSRPVVREVLQKLELQGLVDVVPWKGASVVSFTVQELSDFLDFQGAILGLTARFAAERAQPDQLEAIDACIARMDRANKIGCTAEDFERLRQQAYAHLYAATGPAWAGNQRRQIVTKIYHQYVLDGVATKRLRQEAAGRWKTLLSFLRAKAGAKAEAQMKLMVSKTKEYALVAAASRTTAGEAHDLDDVTPIR